MRWIVRNLRHLTMSLLWTFMLSDYCSLDRLQAQAASRPNIVIILADDIGFGDVQALNHESKIPTPNLDRLASQSMTFTDSHSPSAVCTPTRYG